MLQTFLACLLLPGLAFAQQATVAVSAPATETAAPKAEAPWNPSWRWCRFNDDCVLLKDECKQYTAVNKKYMRPAYDHFTTTTPKIVCGTPIMLPNPQAVCDTKIRTCEVTY